MIKLLKNKTKSKKTIEAKKGLEKEPKLKEEKPKKAQKLKTRKLTKAERKQIKAARRARAKAKSSTKFGVRIVGLILAIVLSAGLIIPGVVVVYKTFFGAKSSSEVDMESFRKLIEELSKAKDQKSAEGGAGSRNFDSDQFAEENPYELEYSPEEFEEEPESEESEPEESKSEESES